MSNPVIIKSPREIECMRSACKLAARTLKMAGELVRPGISTLEIDEAIYTFTIENGAIPATLGYGADPGRGVPPFPKSCCTSINDVVCHGIPSGNDILKEGDIINIDVTSILDGYHGDTSRTFIVGEASDDTKKLVQTAYECMLKGIATVKHHSRIREIGTAIQEHAESLGYGVVKNYVGHGIGTGFHEAPQIPHYKSAGLNLRLHAGMTFTIEPMINMGSDKTVFNRSDGWTVKTADGSLSAQFEHTVLVTPDGHEILTDWSLLDET